MAAGVTLSNKIKYLILTKNIDFSADSFKIILMASGFVFNKDTHHGYADVSGQELATGNGYTQNTKVLTGVSVTEDDTDDRGEVTWANASWTASGGPIGPTPGAMIFDDTPTTPQADPVVQYIDFGGEQTQADGGVATISNIGFNAA
jgi:hypothetical protein